MNEETVTVGGHEVALIRGHTTRADVLEMVYFAVKQGQLEPQAYEEAKANAHEYWTYGWKVTINNKQYGDWVKLDNPTFDDARPTLIEEARQVIEELKRL